MSDPRKTHDDNDGMDKYSVVQNETEKTAHDKAAKDMGIRPPKTNVSAGKVLPPQCASCGKQLRVGFACEACNG